MVTEAGSIKRRFVQKAKEQMEQSGAQFLGVILNKVDQQLGSYGAYGSYGDYGKTKNHPKVKNIPESERKIDEKKSKKSNPLYVRCVND